MARTSTWKKTELYLAKRLKGVRVPITGRARGSTPDIEHPILSLEIKHRASIPKWIYDALDQAIKSKKTGQVPTVIIHESGRNHDQDLVVLTLSEFEKFLDVSKPHSS